MYSARSLQLLHLNYSIVMRMICKRELLTGNGEHRMSMVGALDLGQRVPVKTILALLIPVKHALRDFLGIVTRKNYTNFK
ncbi:hypothetical protein WA1_03220 [Scytonema hofmannii PCC 7110]|uniref:Uncharacterized protein n=1 Tax=Scytonema hofmannii PCC 7110 TaxID=128403 RepID=A0A139XHK6_9CYAN|nr:hypothetical protein WA1_03220 [Scytonema hofmannii PCC 7110]